MSISSELKKLRESRGLSMTKIAKELGIPKGTYASYEYGTREPNIEMINKIANFYDEDTNRLLGRCKKLPPDPIAELCRVYNFSITERAIITAYCAMDKKQRTEFIEQFRQKVQLACENLGGVAEGQASESSSATAELPQVADKIIQPDPDPEIKQDPDTI